MEISNLFELTHYCEIKQNLISILMNLNDPLHEIGVKYAKQEVIYLIDQLNKYEVESFDNFLVDNEIEIEDTQPLRLALTTE
ncbi:hypothetical protein AWH56_008575 [Anaerobacillus isosaccharinicus]|uniref:Uncharacterized protein n=1 Tax=Anaerobacillus isosaccharinicus TaxID=1532552 RepID=A0A1S2L2V9_9BACI|nr:hypothetical protein [Anaerobacillus isosaccharinicus]QOY37619.1 hypothetical protein AWH56_008575 [Anaerobacillus isosaccharinicus]